jgi:hypothetical protein
VLPPTTPYFRVEFDAKRGLVPPGLSEDVRLFFAPTEHRYYYDCIRVRCEKQVGPPIRVFFLFLIHTIGFIP